MAARLNTRFVVSLAVVLAFVAVILLGVYYTVVLRSSNNLEKMGDKIVDVANPSEDDFARAKKIYGKAYRKDASNASALRKMRDTVARWTPASENEYRDAAMNELPSILSALANLEPMNLDSQTARLNIAYQKVSNFGSADSGSWGYLESEAEAVLANYTDNPDAPAGWESLRRFRGIAVTHQTLLGAIVAQRKVDAAIEDLVAALDADAGDWESAQMLTSLYISQGTTASDRNRMSEAERMLQSARDVAKAVIQQNPTDPNALLIGTLSVVHSEQEFASLGKALGERKAAAEASRAEQIDRVRTVFDSLKEVDVSNIHPAALDAAVRLEGAVLRNSLEHSIELNKRAAATAKDNSSTLAASAVLLLRANHPQAAIDLFTEILGIPYPPVSISGLQLMNNKLQSHIGRVEAQTRLVRQAENDEDRAAEIAIADEYLAQARVAVGQPDALLLSEARVAFVKQDIVKAYDAIREFNQKTGDTNIQGISLEAEVLLADSKPSQAADRLRRAISLDESNVRFVLLLGDILANNLLQYENAYTSFSQAVKMQPDNEYAVARMQEIGVLIGRDSSDDPVVNILNNARRLASGLVDTNPDADRAIELLRSGLDEHSDEPRLASLLAQILLVTKQDQPGALAVLRKSLQTHPDNAYLNAQLETTMISDPVERFIMSIDLGTEPETAKLAKKYHIYTGNNMPDQASATMADMVSRFPDDQATLEILFDVAISKKNFGEAERIAGVAETENFDRVGGRFYRAQLARAKGDTKAALQIMEEVISSGTNTASHYLSISQMRAQAGNNRGALAALHEAYQLNPKDRRIVIAYVTALRVDGRTMQSLAIARNSQAMFVNDPVFTDLWLRLEYEAGDKGVVMLRREKVAQTMPNDRGNNLALAALYITNEEYDKAEATIERLDAKDSLIEIITLRARIASSKGDIDGAGKIYQDALATIDGSEHALQIQAHMAYAQFLAGLSRVDDAVAALDRLDEISGLDSLQREQVAMSKASMLIGGQHFEDAVSTLKPIVDGDGKFADQALPMYLTSLASLGKLEEAEQVLDSLDESKAKDVSLRLMRVEILLRKDNRDQARALLDELVSNHSRDARPFIARARLNMLEPETYEDALGDLTRATTLNEDSIEAIRLRAAVNSQLGRLDDLLRDAKLAAGADPNLRVAYPGVIERLLDAQRTGDARSFADDAIKNWPDDLQLKASFASAFASHNQWREARTYYGAAYNQASTPQDKLSMLTQIVDCSLEMNPPDIAAAGSIVNQEGVGIESSPVLLMQRAIVRYLDSQTEQAERDARASLVLSKDNPQAVLSLLDQFRSVFDNEITYASSVQRMRLDEFLPKEWASFVTARATSSVEAETSILTLQALAESDNQALKSAALTELHGVLVSENRHVDAVNALQQLLDLVLTEESTQSRSTIGALHNDIAYQLATYGTGSQDELDRALDHAVTAVALIPGNANVLDTLGVVHLKRGDLSEADNVLGTAFRVSTRGNEIATTLAHIGQLRIAQGRSVSQVADWLDREVDQNSDLKERLSKELAEIQAANR